MAKFDMYLNEDEDLLAEETVKNPKGNKKTKFPKEEKLNRKMSNKLSRNIEKESAEDNKSISILLNKITMGATLLFPDNSVIDNPKHIVKVAENDTPETPDGLDINKADPSFQKKGHAIIRVEYGPTIRNISPELSPQEFCKNIGLKFTTDDIMVLKIFQDPLNIPKGTKYLIVDQYFEYGCICVVEQIVKKNKSNTMLIFKRLDTGGITTYTDVSIRDAKEIRYLK